MTNQHTAELPDARVSSPNRPAAKSNSKLLAPFVLGGIMLPILSGAFLAIDYIGYPNEPTPIAPYVLLPVGLLLAAGGQRLIAGRWEGVTEVLHIRLAYAGLVFVGWAAKYAMAGRSIHRYPAGLLAIIAGILLISRLLAKYHVKLCATVRKSR